MPEVLDDTSKKISNVTVIYHCINKLFGLQTGSNFLLAAIKPIKDNETFKKNICNCC